MAGSYEHLKPATWEQQEASRNNGNVGRFYGGVDTSLCENMGDAIEAMVHMYWMIQILANGDKAKIKKASRQGIEIEVGRARFEPAPEAVAPRAVHVADACKVRFCHECGANVTHEKKK